MFSFFAQRLPRLNTVEPLKLFQSMLRCCMLFFVRANQRGEDRCQQHEHKGLDQADEQFQKVKWHRQERAEDSFCPGRMLNRVRQRFEQVFAGKNISEETK